jgi:hypothetical protein
MKNIGGNCLHILRKWEGIECTSYMTKKNPIISGNVFSLVFETLFFICDFAANHYNCFPFSKVYATILPFSVLILQLYVPMHLLLLLNYIYDLPLSNRNRCNGSLCKRNILQWTTVQWNPLKSNPVLLSYSATEPYLIDPSVIESFIYKDNLQLYTVNDHFMYIQLRRYSACTYKCRSYCPRWVWRNYIWRPWIMYVSVNI